MIRFLSGISAILLLVGAVYLLAPEILILGTTLVIAGLLLKVFLYLISSRGVQDIFTPVTQWKRYESPGDIIEAGALLESHRYGRLVSHGGDVHITQDVWQSDYSVNLNARTLLNSNDPKIVVHDERSDPDVEISW
jgi:hypothetical protein